MSKHKLIFLTSLIFLLARTIIPGQDRGYIVEVGQFAPDFTALLENGDSFNLSSNLGNVVMLQFTASWCGVCREEMPFIESEIYQKLKEKDFVLIGIDRDELEDVVSAYARKMKITYPLALDPGSNIFSLFALKESGVTRNVIIDREGRIIYLTRLFEREEFDKMKEIIFNQF